MRTTNRIPRQREAKDKEPRAFLQPPTHGPPRKRSDTQSRRPRKLNPSEIRNKADDDSKKEEIAAYRKGQFTMTNPTHLHHQLSRLSYYHSPNCPRPDTNEFPSRDMKRRHPSPRTPKNSFEKSGHQSNAGQFGRLRRSSIDLRFPESKDSNSKRSDVSMNSRTHSQDSTRDHHSNGHQSRHQRGRSNPFSHSSKSSATSMRSSSASIDSSSSSYHSSRTTNKKNSKRKKNYHRKSNTFVLHSRLPKKRKPSGFNHFDKYYDDLESRITRIEQTSCMIDCVSELQCCELSPAHYMRLRERIAKSFLIPSATSTLDGLLNYLINARFDDEAVVAFQEALVDFFNTILHDGKDIIAFGLLNCKTSYSSRSDPMGLRSEGSETFASLPHQINAESYENFQSPWKFNYDQTIANLYNLLDTTDNSEISIFLKAQLIHQNGFGIHAAEDANVAVLFELPIDDDQYHALGNPLGCGGQGEVVLAFRESDKKLMCLKIVDCSNDPAMMRTELREADFGKRIDSEYISAAKATGFFSSRVVHVIDLEYGGSLRGLRKLHGPLPEPLVRRIVVDILHGLDYLHNSAHVAHRDLKPDNILLSSADLRSAQAKLIDLGYACDSRYARSVASVGTNGFQAPELFCHDRKLYMPSLLDVWSLGIVVVVLITGERPPDYDTMFDERKRCEFIHDLPISNEGKSFLLDGTLIPDYDRMNVQQLLEHAWIGKRFEHDWLDDIDKRHKKLLRERHAQVPFLPQVRAWQADTAGATQDRSVTSGLDFSNSWRSLNSSNSSGVSTEHCDNDPASGRRTGLSNTFEHLNVHPTVVKSPFPAAHRRSKSRKRSLSQSEIDTNRVESIVEAKKNKLSCPLCDEPMSKTANLLRHCAKHVFVEVYPPMGLAFKCQLHGCEKRFARHDTLKMHYKKHMEDPKVSVHPRVFESDIVAQREKMKKLVEKVWPRLLRNKH